MRRNQHDHDPLAGPAESLLARGLSRRGFLVGTGVAGAAVAVAACSSSSKSNKASSSSTSPPSSSGGGANGDLQTAAFAAGLEVLAVQTYQAALNAATTNKLGAVPPAGAEFVKTAMAQHQAQLDKWNSVLQGGGQPMVDTPNAKLKPTVDSAFAQVTDFGGAAKLALTLEQTAAATYLKAIPTLKGKDAIQLAGSINIIDMQHAAVLHFVLGEYPVPDVFAKTDMAAN